jgi:hypothetical protein
VNGLRGTEPPAWHLPPVSAPSGLLSRRPVRLALLAGLHKLDRVIIVAGAFSGAPRDLPLNRPRILCTRTWDVCAYIPAFWYSARTAALLPLLIRPRPLVERLSTVLDTQAA